MNEIHLPTISGAINVLSMDITKESTKKVYRAVLNQLDALAPIVQKEVNEVGGLPVVTRLVAGTFLVTFAPSTFLGANSYVRALNNRAIGQIYEATAIIFDDVIQLNIFNTVGVSVDAFMNQCDLELTVYSDISTDALIFAEMLNRLDANQLEMWNKIVLRNGGTVTEVDGKLWRKLGNFAQSSSVIKS